MSLLKSWLEERKEEAAVLLEKRFRLGVSEAMEMVHLGRACSRREALKMWRLSLPLRGSGSSAGEERAWVCVCTAKKLSAFRPLCHLPC